MTQDIGTLHHQSKRRKPIAKKISKKSFHNFLDKLIIIVAIIGPLFAFPQIYKIYSTQIVAGISLTYWLSYLILGSIWLTYALVHKRKHLIFSSIMWEIVNITIVVGIIKYG